jgi:hypothetical protein
MKEPYSTKDLTMLNRVFREFNEAKDSGLNLYAMTFKFNYLKDFKAGGSGELQAEERILHWTKGVLQRLYARPWKEHVFGYVFFDVGDSHGAHAHGLIAISDEGYRKKYAGKMFDECFKGEEYARWIKPTSPQGEKDLLKSYWIGKWDGEGGLLKYSGKSYELGGSFYSSNPVYFNGRLCIPRWFAEAGNLDNRVN